MIKAKKYSELVATAEEAVAKIADPALKAIGFQTVLTSLINDAGADGSARPAPTSTLHRQPETAAAHFAARKPKAKSGTTAYLNELVTERFFLKPKTIAAVKTELESRGHHIPRTSLSGPLQSLCQGKILRRQKFKPTNKNNEVYGYSDW